MNTNRKALSALTLIASLTLLFPTLHAAPPEDKGKSGNGKQKDNDSVRLDLNLSATVTAGISAGDAHNLASRQGISGGKPLPPGIRKNLARGKPMPPGIQKTRLPQSFVDELPRHNGYEWQRAGVDLVLVASGSLIIADMLEGVFD